MIPIFGDISDDVLAELPALNETFNNFLCNKLQVMIIKSIQMIK